MISLGPGSRFKKINTPLDHIWRAQICGPNTEFGVFWRRSRYSLSSYNYISPILSIKLPVPSYRFHSVYPIDSINCMIVLPSKPWFHRFYGLHKFQWLYQFIIFQRSNQFHWFHSVNHFHLYLSINSIKYIGTIGYINSIGSLNSISSLAFSDSNNFVDNPIHQFIIHSITKWLDIGITKA